jgi:hypothetical protein
LEQDQTTKYILQQEEFKRLFSIAHRNSNKTAVFEISKNFMLRFDGQKIKQKLL